MSEEDVWSRLGIEPTQEVKLIKQAYARLIRTYRPESHPKEFAEIRDAFEAAQFLAQRDVESFQEVSSNQASSQASNQRPDQQTPSSDPVVNAVDPKRWVLTLLEAVQPGDAAQSTLFHSQYAALADQSIDFKIDYEGYLLYGLLSSSAPPLSILFDASRLFRWPERRADIVQMFGEGGARRLGLLMEMAYEFTYARNFCSNRWKRRLFDDAAAKVPRIASFVHAKAALETGNYWEQLCDAGELPQMRQLMNPLAFKRLQGGLIYSTDILLSILVTFFAFLSLSDEPDAQKVWLVWGKSLLVGLGAIILAGVWRWFITTALFKKVIAFSNSTAILPKIACMAVVGLLVFLVMMALDKFGPVPASSVGPVAFVVVIFSALAFAKWFLLRYLERKLIAPWMMLQWASDVFLFDSVRQSKVQIWSVPSFKSRILALPSSVKVAWAERKRLREVRKQNEREAQANFSSASEGNNLWWIWIVLIVLFSLGKAVSK